MKNKKFAVVTSLILAICMICGILSACAPVEKKAPLESITLSKTSEEIYVGDTLSLTATPSRELYEDETIEWVSDETDIATVTARGLVKGVAGGSAVITAKVGDVSASCTITVKTRTISIEAPDNLTLELLDETKNTVKLSATSSDGSAVTWASADTSIATVDADGTVKAVGKGEVKISARVGATESSVTVTVNAPEDYYLLGRNNNATVYETPGIWHWFTQGKASYDLVAEPMHVNGTATLSFSKMVFTDDEEANGEKMEYYFRYNPGFENGTYNFTCKMTTTISGRITIGIDDVNNFEAQEFELVAGQENSISVANIPVVENKPLNIRIYIKGATAENPLTIKLFDYSFTQNA